MSSQSTALPLEKLAGKYLIFDLGRELYGLPVLRIRKIIRETRVTPMPDLPAHIKGVINLRGKIIPVMDLRTRFGLAETESGHHRCIIVVQAHGTRTAEIHVGLLVDNVQEVLPIAGNEIEEAPEFGGAINRTRMLGLARLKSRVVILLNIDLALTLNSDRAEPANKMEVSLA